MSEDTHESGEKDSTNDEYDQDNSISFENDTESTSSQEEELEEWIEYMKRSAREAYDIQNHRLGRPAEWNPGLVISTRTQRKTGRQAKRWEDDLNEFVKDVKDAETETTRSFD